MFFSSGSRRQVDGPKAFYPRSDSKATPKTTTNHARCRSRSSSFEAALAATETGLVATAAGVIASKSSLAHEQDKPKKKKRKKPRYDEEQVEQRPIKPAASIVKQLLSILGRADAENDIELTSSAIEALGALGIAEASHDSKRCGSSWPEIRKRASKVLGGLSNKVPTCSPPAGRGPLPAEAMQPIMGDVTLTLDGRIAPMAVTRIVELARAGFSCLYFAVAPWASCTSRPGGEADIFGLV